MVVDITAVNPITQEPFKGVKFYITEVKDKFSVGLNSNQKRTQIYSGETDANGKAYYEFEVPKKYKWTYEINFDFSQMDMPTGDYHINKGGHFDYLQRNYDNVFDFELMPYTESYTHIKNINCFDSNDKMRYRTKYIDTGTGNWSIWHTPYNQDYIEGCYELSSDVDITISERIVYEMEVTKNSVTTITIDTFYRAPNVVNAFELFYFFAFFAKQCT